RQAGKKTPGLLGQASGPFKEDESCADRLRLGIPAMASQSQSSAGRDPVHAATQESKAKKKKQRFCHPAVQKVKMGFIFSKSMNENMKSQQEFMLMSARLQ
ncbi:hypothetical protein E2I00_004939, partial [Balaenoptera physalus]